MRNSELIKKRAPLSDALIYINNNCIILVSLDYKFYGYIGNNRDDTYFKIGSFTPDDLKSFLKSRRYKEVSFKKLSESIGKKKIIGISKKFSQRREGEI